MMKLHHGNLKVVEFVIEFMMELHCRTLEGNEASVEASPHGLPYPV